MTDNIKSPFFVLQEFISPLECENIISKVKINEPIFNEDGYPEKMERFHAECEDLLFARFKPHVPAIEERYGLKYRGTEKLLFQYFPVSSEFAESPRCANSQYIRKKWVKTRDRDLTGILWLRDYQNETPIDTSHEVYGGKLEFPQYQFSLQPQRGTLILYPAYPNFITTISQVLVGELYCVRFNITAEGSWFYDPQQFGGTWSEWFKDYA